MSRISPSPEQVQRGLLSSWKRGGQKGLANAKKKKKKKPTRNHSAVNLPLSLQCLYVSLPALLECNPFQNECRESWRPSPPLPEELHRVVLIYQAALDLLHQYEVHPEITSQMFAYLFFFSNTLLFNQLLDKGQSPLNTPPGLGNLQQTGPLGDPPVHPSVTAGGTGESSCWRGWRWTSQHHFGEAKHSPSCCLLSPCSQGRFNPMSAPSSPPAGALPFRAQAEDTQSSLEGQLINKLLQPALEQGLVSPH